MVKRHRMLSFLVCIVLAAAFMGCAATETKRATGEVIDDSAITTKVKAALVEDPVTKAYQINVDTFRGDVMLSGFVDSAQAVAKAGEVARGVKGVKSVKNNLKVK